MPTINQLEFKLNKMEKSKKFAWGKYYGEMNNRLEQNTTQFITMSCMVESIPEHIKTEFINMIEELKKEIECPICYDIIQKGELKITNCGHKYCNNCFDKLVETSNKCALCKKQLKY